MGQAKYRKRNDPNYGAKAANEIQWNPGTGYPDYYPEELVNKINSREDDGLTEDNLERIHAHLGHLGEYCQKFVCILDSEFYNIEPMRVAFAMLNSTRLGAFAYTSIGSSIQEKFDFIGVNLGTPAVLLSNFYKILNSPHSFIGYGDYEKEDPERSFHILSVLTDPEKDFVPPICPVRKEYAVLMTQLALDFILLHEATHLYHGHVDWLIANRSGEPSSIDSFTDLIIPPKDLARQFFEVDADDCALQLTISNILEYRERYNAGKLKVDPEKIPAYDLIFGSELLTLRAVLYSIYVLHRGSDYEIWSGEINSGSHPRGLLRARYIFNRFLDVTNWLGIEGNNRDGFMDLCIAVVFEAEQDLARMEDRAVDKQTFIDVIKSENASLHMRAINEIQSSIESETSAYVRGNLFPGTSIMRSKIDSTIQYRGVKPTQFRRP